jgi:pimeloyl-ACP methyl ester carboxylesterase
VPALSLLWHLLGSGDRGSGDVASFCVSVGSDLVPVQVSGRASSGKCLLFSTGFAGSRFDYGSLCRLFEDNYLVVRIAHPGSGRRDGLKALLRFSWYRWVKLLDQGNAARRVRGWIHREANCLRRRDQLLGVAAEIGRRFQIDRFSLAGHSFGTDTALRGAQVMVLDSLYLFSPHPPGYLIPTEDYSRLRTEAVLLVTGTLDRTRDGVGPSERLRVAEVCEALPVILDGVRHMDFAFADLGPSGWLDQLGLTLSFAEAAEGCST